MKSNERNSDTNDGNKLKIINVDINKKNSITKYGSINESRSF